MDQIPLTRGLFTVVDDADHADLSRFRWHAHGAQTGLLYAARNEGGRMVYMHKVLLPGVPFVDHRNGDSLDNRRLNLRPCTRSQNNQNARPRNGCSSRFKGVYWHKRGRRWLAQIQGAEKLYLGLFDTEEAAARAYDEAAKLHFGEFARLNFPEQ